MRRALRYYSRVHGATKKPADPPEEAGLPSRGAAEAPRLNRQAVTRPTLSTTMRTRPWRSASAPRSGVLAMCTSTRRLVHQPSALCEVASTVSLSSHIVEPVQSALLRGIASRALPVCWRLVLFLGSSAGVSVLILLPRSGLWTSHWTPLRRKGSSMVLSALNDVWKRMTKQKMGSRSLIGSSSAFRPQPMQRNAEAAGARPAKNLVMGREVADIFAVTANYSSDSSRDSFSPSIIMPLTMRASASPKMVAVTNGHWSAGRIPIAR